VGRNLFASYASHRAGSRGDEEIGWVLLGVRREHDVLVLATLPAGAHREAGVAHVRFNSSAQAVASVIVRQHDKRLRIVGVVHTHPGSLRHPSDADYRGDVLWVGQLRGGEGVFGIGTADADCADSFAYQPEPHRQCLQELGFSWYALATGQKRYRKLPLEITLGPDLAQTLHPLWGVIERHASALERLCRQQMGIRFEIATGKRGDSRLIVSLPLVENDSLLKVVIGDKEVEYFLDQQGMLSRVDPGEERIDKAVYLLLAELCAIDSRDEAPVATSNRR